MLPAVCPCLLAVLSLSCATERKKGAADPSVGVKGDARDGRITGRWSAFVLMQPHRFSLGVCLSARVCCAERKKGAADPSVGVKSDARDGRMTGKMWFIQQLAAGEDSQHYRLYAVSTHMYMCMDIVHAHVHCAKEEGTGALGVKGARGWAHHRQAVVHSAVGSRGGTGYATAQTCPNLQHA
jgi:hypothetical protein